MDDQAQLCKHFTDEAITFIRKNKNRPFFVYLPHCFIHYPQIARQEFMDEAEGNNTRAVVEEIDWSVGRIRQTLEELGLAENTLVIFTSDNGGPKNNGPLRGGKGSTWEGGMRVATLACWRGTIPANSTCDEIATQMDFLTTFAALAGGTPPQDRIIDGKDISSLLLDKAGAKSPHEAFFYYKGNELEAVRSGEWKLFTNDQLYNLEKDIGERHNAADKNPQIVTRLKKYLQQARNDMGNPENCRPVGKNPNPRYLVSVE
jgi:arylsulfatase A-like enzyme